MSKKEPLIKKNALNEEVFKKVKNKKSLLISFLIVFICIAIGSIILSNKHNNLGIFETVAKVNGEPIVYGEFNHYLQTESSEIYTYFKNKYGVEDNKGFWTTAYEGQIPIELLKKQALDSSVKDKVQQIIAKKMGIVKNISYRQMLLDMKATNEKRQQMVNNNQVIYGPITFDEQRYLADAMVNLSRDLKDKLKVDFVFSDKDYRDYYENNKEKYALGSSRKIKAIAVNFTDNQDKNKKVDAVKAKLAEIKKRLDAGIDFNVIYDQLEKRNDENIKVFEKDYGANVPKSESISNPSLIGAITKLDVGQVTGIIEENMSIGIYKCVEKEASGYGTLENVKPSILLDLTDIKYSELADQWVKDADIEIIEYNMKGVKMR